MKKVLKVGCFSIIGVTLLLVAISVLAALFGNHETVSQNTNTTKEITTKISIEKMVDNLKKEPKIKDVLYQPNAAVQWSIGVINDGTSRNGYAMYICDVLKEHGYANDNTVVRIADIVKVANGSTPRAASIGSARCSDYKPFD